ncbi:MAG: RnfABCDGE type electron transport complex subunit D [Deltaproteobacteria bacterium]|nr:RnfABCDGE type electron transport complex subunit D [Deltaproteobacteria bacterium]
MSVLAEQPIEKARREQGLGDSRPPPPDASQGAEAIPREPKEAKEDWGQKIRLGGLRRFAFAITLLNVVGHLYLGFETSWAHPLAALATGYGLELLLESIDARANRRAPRFRGGGVKGLVDFLLSAHISSLAVSMLIYPNQRLWPVVFATAVAVGSKVIFRVRVGERLRHPLNPSNLGIATTLLLFPWVGIAPPYQFTENISGIADWIFPLIIICTGSLINTRYTSRLPLLAAWLGGFALQALLRHWLFDAALLPALAPMTGLAFLLFTFYMITDPPTTPSSPRAQLAFGLSVAATYGLLVINHIVFGLFFALVIVCSIRGSWLWLSQRAAPAPRMT